jgi:hypothetical protein
MHSFCQVVHKSTSETNELYHFSTKQKNKKEMGNEFCRIAWNYEHKPNPAISIEDDLVSRMIKIFFHMFAVGPIQYSIQTKFSYFKKTIDNVFMNGKTRNEFILKFCKIQRSYWALNRFVHNYKFRKAEMRVKTDLILNPIRESQHNVITIMHNNSKYLFTVGDLKNIIESALSNSPFLFSTPLAPKNPYNNIPFDRATLYNIYFFMKQGNFVLSNMFHNYFLCNFNLKRFRDENEVIIRKKHIESYCNNSDINELYFDALDMIKMNKFTKQLRIDAEFPRNQLVDIMRPYLAIYYTSMFSLNISERSSSLTILNSKLRRFYNFNPKFGRRYIKLGKDEANKVLFNDFCIEFGSKNNYENYPNSHLELDPDENPNNNVYGLGIIQNGMGFIRNIIEAAPVFEYDNNIEQGEDSEESSDSEDESN